MTVGIKSIDFAKAKAKSEAMRLAANAAMSDAILESSANLVPYLTGHLRLSGEAESDRKEGRVTWGNADVKYARVQYYKFPHKRMHGTVPYWFDAAKARDFAMWLKKVGFAVGEVAAK